MPDSLTLRCLTCVCTLRENRFSGRVDLGLASLTLAPPIVLAGLVGLLSWLLYDSSYYLMFVIYAYSILLSLALPGGKLVSASDDKTLKIWGA